MLKTENNEENYENIVLMADDKINLGENLKTKLDPFKQIDGIEKLQRKIDKEIKFLRKAKTTTSLKINHITCSNLTHFEFLINVLLKQNNIRHVDYGIDIRRKHPLRIDIVCENGHKWIKVIARNTKSLSDAVNGRASYGAKSILDQADDFLQAATENPHMFKPPKVVFQFYHEIDDEIQESLKSIGIEVATNFTSTIYTSKCEDETNLLNLDISTMLAYISSLTNGSHDWIFKEPILTEQAQNEKKFHVKDILNNLFIGKKLICCETAVSSFNEIVEMLGGINEKERAKELLNKVEILPDVDTIPEELNKINISGKIKPRSLKIFAFGIAKKAITVTSNEGFIRSAQMQGINIPAFIHQARALTECKEESAQTCDP